MLAAQRVQASFRGGGGWGETVGHGPGRGDRLAVGLQLVGHASHSSGSKPAVALRAGSPALGRHRGPIPCRRNGPGRTWPLRGIPRAQVRRGPHDPLPPGPAGPWDPSRVSGPCGPGPQGPGPPWAWSMRTMWIVDSVGLADVVVVDVTEGHERSWSNGMSSGSSFFPPIRVGFRLGRRVEQVAVQRVGGRGFRGFAGSGPAVGVGMARGFSVRTGSVPAVSGVAAAGPRARHRGRRPCRWSWRVCPGGRRR